MGKRLRIQKDKKQTKQDLFCELTLFATFYDMGRKQHFTNALLSLAIWMNSSITYDYKLESKQSCIISPSLFQLQLDKNKQTQTHVKSHT